MTIIGTTFNITLITIRDETKYKSFAYQDGRVSGPEWSFTDPITVDDVKGVRAAITEFKDLILHNCQPPTGGDRQPTSLEIKEIPGVAEIVAVEAVEAVAGSPATIEFEFTVGDLIASMVYNKDANTFTGEQSAFDVVWCDFIAYIIAWDQYLEVVETRDIEQ